MIRRFNYTNRIKIPRNKVEITLHKDNEGKYFKARVNFDELNLPPEAKVYIEGYYKGVYQRFDFGTVANFKEPASTRLSELPETEFVYFDISIVDESEKIGLLLGKASGIPISTNEMPNDRIPLLYVNPVDLKNEFWRVAFEESEDNRPVLEINNRIPDIYEMAKTDVKFMCLVYPSAFRIVLKKIIDEGDFDVEEGHWISQWLKFINGYLGIKHLPDTENVGGILTPDQEEWINECVNEYCLKLQLFEKFIAP